MAEEIIKARVWTKVDTLENWNNNPMLLGPGEMALVTTPSGIPLNMKWGDKTERKRFSDLPFVISYDQGQFVAVDGPGELPTPESDVAYSLVGPGTYTFSGQADIVAPDGRLSQLVWDGTSWSLVDMGELPVAEIDKTDVISSPSERVTTETAVIDYATPLTSLRILPVGYIYIPDDRPDLDLYNVIIIDKNGNYLEQESGNGGGDLPDGYEYIADDRPDSANLGLVLVDSNYYYIPQSNESAAFDNLIAFQDFGEMEGYAVETVKDPNDYWQIWEGMRTADSNYVTRQPLRNSSLLGLPIWRYDFKPKSPKIKVLLIGLAHGWEKNISFGWARLMNQLVNDWRGNEALTLIRQNVHFITVPLMSPDNFVTNPFNGSNRTRSRQNYETDWIQASFSASGTDINVTFTEANFPTNELHTFADYFQERKDDIEGKTGVTVIDSTDTNAVKHNAVYRLKTVISTGNIVLTNDISVTGTVTGTLKFCVRVDPERNYPTSTWARFTPGSPTSAPITYYDNKGTKPISTMENANVFDIINSNNDLATIIDFHSGAGDYVTYISATNKDKSFDVLNSMFESLFNVETSTPASTYPMSSVYAAESLGIHATLPEWHSSEPPEVGDMTNEQATELHNWLGNILHVTSIRNINNKK